MRGTQATDAGVAYFQGCKNLTEHYLMNTNVTDAGVAYFQDCKKLANFLLSKTMVSAAKVEELKRALPHCRIDWDGATN